MFNLERLYLMQNFKSYDCHSNTGSVHELWHFNHDCCDQFSWSWDWRFMTSCLTSLTLPLSFMEVNRRTVQDSFTPMCLILLDCFVMRICTFYQISAKFWLLLRSRASVLLSEGCWFESALSACWSVLWQDTEPQTAPDVLVGSLHGSRHHQCVNLCINFCKSLWMKASDR